ncbi:MAG: glycosyltransferase [Candidatus Altiarchaeales archaeon]|nr:glycosyltransferase [Candidatus Altiarchaeales archaeon]MBD3415515.1 glycosyltransferase [Candidatus Altiarchaeales archaeon]
MCGFFSPAIHNIHLLRFQMDVTLYRNVSWGGWASDIRYTTNLLDNLPDNVRGYSIRAPSLPFIKHYLHKEVIYPLAARGHQGDVNHISDHSYAGLLRALDPSKTLVTCQDLIPLDAPGEASKLGLMRYRLNVSCLPRAAKIIAVSQSTKDALMRHFNIADESIEVVYHGVGGVFKPLHDRGFLRKKHGFTNPTILHVGSSYPRKNVRFILEVLKDIEGANLVKVGFLNRSDRRFMAREGLSTRVLQIDPPLDDIRLNGYYNMADLLFMPSLHEGFGHPVTEAMAAGCPVLCSDIPVFHELFDGAVEFTSPYDVGEAGSKVRDMLASDRTKLARKGLDKAGELTLQREADSTYKVYEEVHEQRR